MRVLRAIVCLTQEHGKGPTIRELCEAISATSTDTVRGHLDLLEKRALIERQRLIARGIIASVTGLQLVVVDAVVE